MERGEQQLGNYRLKQILGKGAFADVYLGEHLYLNTPVAVKVLHSRLIYLRWQIFSSRHVTSATWCIRTSFVCSTSVWRANTPFLVMD